MNGDWLRKTLAEEVRLIPLVAEGDWGVLLLGEIERLQKGG